MGDQLKKFAQVYSDYYTIIFNRIYSKTSNIDTAGDLTQEVFIRYLRKIDHVEKPFQWLFGAIQYVIMEHYRNEKVIEDNIDEVCDDISICSVNGVDDTKIIIQQAIDDADNYRDDKDRIIFDLVAINNYTYSEAARELGLTHDQVRYNYNTVVAKITDNLKKKGVNNLEDLL